MTPESLECDDLTDSVNQHAEKADVVTLDQELRESVFGGIPFEPPRKSDQAVNEPDKILWRLLNFYLYGVNESGTGTLAPEALPIPALLYPYRDLSSVRHDYPVCLGTGAPETAVRPLTQVIDELIAGVAAEGDDGERLKRHVYQLESVIRSLAGQEPDAGLLGLWDRAAKSLVSSLRLSKTKQDRLRENLGTARRALDTDHEIIACGADAPGRLLTTLATSHWQQKCKDWRAQLGSLIQQMQDILDADFNRSAEAKSPQHLSQSTGIANEEIDFTAMSSILSGSQPEHRLPEERRKRIKKALDALLRVKPVYNVAVLDGDGAAEELPFPMHTMVEDCADAVARYETQMQIMVDFFKFVNIARLEAGNYYREKVHDRYFENFGITHLTNAETRLFPPVLVSLKSSSINNSDTGKLLDILSTTAPIKILLHIDELDGNNNTADQTSTLVGWPARLANMATTLTHVFVMQAPVSRLDQLRSGFLQGLDYAGPALFSVYVGNTEHRPGLPPYLDAAAATESRVFPIINFNPGQGTTLAERFDILQNQQCDQDWIREAFTYRTADGVETTLDLAFTPADFLFNDKRLSTQFWCLPPQLWHENMLPLQAFLQLDEQSAGDKIPYLLTVDEEGLLVRVAMTRFIVAATVQNVSFWHHLQETGGINNSFALALIATEEERLAAEKQGDIEAIEQRYREQLDQDLGKLTEEIIQRIAGQLVLDAGTVGMQTTTTPQPAAQTIPAPDAAAPPEETAAELPAEVTEEEEEEEISALDEAYIETPRCTTCDECTKLNGQIFAYDDNKQAYIADTTAGPYKDLVRAAELCPVKIIHPGKPTNETEPNLEDLMKRAEPFM